MFTLLVLCFGSTTTTLRSEAENEADSAAISRFLASTSFERPCDREYALATLEKLSGFEAIDPLAGVRFYVYATEASSLAGHVALAVTDQSEVLAVGEESEFNRLILKMGVVITEPEEAEQVARDYLRLRYVHQEVWLGVRGGLNFISSADDVPFSPGKEEHEVERYDLLLNHQLQVPAVERTKTGFAFRADTWGPWDGLVREHLVDVSPDGTIEYRQRRFAEAYGEYKTGCTFPLDYGPNVGALTRLARNPDADARLAVARYIKYLAGSDFILHRSLFEDHSAEFLQLAQKLAEDLDEAVRHTGFEAVDAVEGNPGAR